MPAFFACSGRGAAAVQPAGCMPRDHLALARIGEMPVEGALCPFSIQVDKKLMQKIHRLTDN
jgi:hypothetical protein